MAAVRVRPLRAPNIRTVSNAAMTSESLKQNGLTPKRVMAARVRQCCSCLRQEQPSKLFIPQKDIENEMKRGRRRLVWATLDESARVAEGLRVSEEKRKASSIPVIFSLDRRKVDVQELSFLLASAGLSTGLLDRGGGTKRWDPERLQRALDNSTSVVAAFTRSSLDEDYMPARPSPSASQSSPLKSRTGQREGGLLDWWEDQQSRLLGPLKLVGFARTTSDCSLVGAIHDIAVAPCARGQGIGKRLVRIAVRELVKQDIDDIAVLSYSDLRPFFENCGFGPDQMDSTFMFYTAQNMPSPLRIPYPIKRPEDLFELQTTTSSRGE